jgi:hypothetical protein
MIRVHNWYWAVAVMPRRVTLVLADPNPRKNKSYRPGFCWQVRWSAKVANIQDGHIVLTPRTKPSYPAKLVTDPVTGLPALSAGRNAPVLTPEEIEQLLADFPWSRI